MDSLQLLKNFYFTTLQFNGYGICTIKPFTQRYIDKLWFLSSRELPYRAGNFVTFLNSNSVKYQTECLLFLSICLMHNATISVLGFWLLRGRVFCCCCCFVFGTLVIKYFQNVKKNS